MSKQKSQLQSLPKRGKYLKFIYTFSLPPGASTEAIRMLHIELDGAVSHAEFLITKYQDPKT